MKYLLVFFLNLQIFCFGQFYNTDSLIGRIKIELVDTNQVNLLNKISFSYINTDLDKAYSYAYKALKMAEQIKFSSGCAESYNNLGLISKSKADYKKSLLYFKVSKLMYEKNHNINYVLAIDKNIGDVHRLMGNLDSSLFYYHKSLLGSKKVNNKKVISASYIGIGNVYMMKEVFDSSLVYYISALDIEKNQNNTNTLLVLYNNMGNIFLQQKNYPKAIFYYNESYKIALKNKQKFLIGTTTNNLGLSYHGMKNYNNALRYLLLSLEIRKKEGNKEYLAETLSNIGEVYFAQKKYDDAIYYSKESYVNAIETDNDQSILHSLRFMVPSLLKLKEIKEAEKFSKEYLNISQKLNKPEHIAYAYKCLSELNFEKNELKQAYNYLILYSTINDSILNSESAKRVAEMEVRYNLEKNEAKIKELQFNEEKQKNILERKNSLILYSFIVFGLLLIVIILLFNIYKKYKDKNQLKIEIQKVEIQKNLLELESRFLISQMNPHFIFNTISSIESFIIKNENHKAIEYLNDFSVLTRNILESSRKEFISLKEEVEIIGNYLKLEQMRLNFSFQYQIEVRDTLNSQLEVISIPPMILQPFVENSILHGFKNDTLKNSIHITFIQKENEYVVIEVIDNGIGRVKAAEIKNINNKTHQSLATQITKERIDIIEKKYSINIIVDVVDLYDENNFAKGTKVVITLPII